NHDRRRQRAAKPWHRVDGHARGGQRQRRIGEQRVVVVPRGGQRKRRQHRERPDGRQEIALGDRKDQSDQRHQDQRTLPPPQHGEIEASARLIVHRHLAAQHHVLPQKSRRKRRSEARQRKYVPGQRQRRRHDQRAPDAAIAIEYRQEQRQSAHELL